MTMFRYSGVIAPEDLTKAIIKVSEISFLVKAFTAASGKEIAYEFVGRREGDIATSYCNAGLAEKELGWKSKRTIKEMCEDTWRWQSKNPDGYHSSS